MASMKDILPELKVIEIIKCDAMIMFKKCYLVVKTWAQGYYAIYNTES